MARAAEQIGKLESEQVLLDGRILRIRRVLTSVPVSIERAKRDLEAAQATLRLLRENRAALREAPIVKWERMSELATELNTNRAQIAKLTAALRRLESRLQETRIEMGFLNQRRTEIVRNLSSFGHLIHAEHRFGGSHG